MLSHASREHNLILMFYLYIQSYHKLYYDIINVMLPSDDVALSLCYLVLPVNMCYWH